MPPTSRVSTECLNTTNIDHTLAGSAKPNTDQDIHALLYIVCTLLFYSLGIIIGIVKYLKQEKQEIEESKMFDDFIALKSDFSKGVYTLYRRQQVYEVVQKLEEIEKKRLTLEHDICASLHSLSDGKHVKESVSVNDNWQDEPSFSENNIQKLLLRQEKIYSSVSSLNCDEDKHITNSQVETENSTMSDACNAVVMAANDVTDDVTSHSEQCEEMTDPFPNRRLSQVVARILDSSLNVHESEDLDTTYEDISEEEYELETDFIDYHEEPKNKELFRGSFRELSDSLIFESNPIKDAVFEEDLEDKLLASMQARSVETAEEEDDIHVFHEAVTTTTDSRGTETVFDVIASRTPREAEKLRCSSIESLRSGGKASCEETPFRWSVTSV